MSKAGSRQLQRKSDARPEFLVLGLLSGGPAHGYELFRRFGQSLGKVWRLSQSQLYAVLKRLEARGLVKAAAGAESGGLERSEYELTVAGRRSFEEWLLAPSASSARSIRLEFVARLYFARVSGSTEVRMLLRQQRASIAGELVSQKQALAAIPIEDVYNRLGLDFKLHQLQAVYDWLETLDGQL